MEAKQSGLQSRFEELLKEIAEVSTQMELEAGKLKNVPHYSEIELRAHFIGRQVSQAVQQRQLNEVVARRPEKFACPTCGEVCLAKSLRRQLRSIDGSVDLAELKAHCHACRRDFFPSA